MLFQNLETGAFGLTVGQVRVALPNIGIPDEPASLDPDTGFAVYAETSPPVGAWDQTVAEVAPIDGQQQWAVTTLTGEALAAAQATLIANLEAYANGAQEAKMAGGITVGGTPIGTDPVSLSLITGAYLKATGSNPPATFNFQVSSAPITFVSLTTAEVVAAGQAVFAYVQAAFDALAPVAAQIQAGTITTTAQIDAAFAAVSQTF